MVRHDSICPNEQLQLLVSPMSKIPLSGIFTNHLGSCKCGIYMTSAEGEDSPTFIHLEVSQVMEVPQIIQT